jgi:proline-specific peptidase
MKRGTFLFLLTLLAFACREFSTSAPREGYLGTPDGVRLFYRIVGDGSDKLIVLHGGPANSMDSILPDLEPLAHGRTVIYYDQRGNGRSELINDPDKLSISKHVEDLETVRKFFKLDKVALLGNSWGGMLAAFYAVAHPDRVERMVLHSPGEPTRSSMVKADEEMLARLDRHLSPQQKERYAFLADPQHWIDAEDPKALCREYYQLLLPFYVADPRSISRLKGDVCSAPDDAVRRQLLVNEQIVNSLGDWNLLPSLGAVDSPVLIVYGTADPAAPETPGAWAKALPNSRLLVIDDAGHLPHVDQPALFFSAVETFLKGDFPSGAKDVRATAENN